ncbi:MAG: endonuclease III [Bacteriovoracaceae bacterium]|nr:endonuclease III [Bacteriovoracaceae bacterium]
MAKEKNSDLLKRSQKIVTKLREVWPDAHCELDHETPFQLLIATILSAQCTDKRVNMVTPVLFAKYPDAKTLAKAPVTDVEEIIRTTGFFKNKAKNIIQCARQIEQDHKGELPRTIEELTQLGGVGRKTANVLLGNAFRINEGIVVDTHVKRISKLLKLTTHEDPEKVEKDLIKIVPNADWTDFSHLLIFLGRRICIARRPQCSLCPVNKYCPSAKI